jgi:predicted transposase YbfD/YdcC
VGRRHAQEVRAALGARRDAPDHFAVPAEATIRRTLSRLDPDVLAGAIGAWLADRERHRPRPAASRRRAVAVDGKTLRGARPRTPGGGSEGRPVHLLAAMDHTTRAVLAQRQVGGAPEEVTAFAPLLAPLDLAGTVVTTDALQTHPEAAEFLVNEKRVHYLFVVKANQPTLLDRCQRLPWHRVPVLDRTGDRGHGRIELRTLKAVSVGRFGSPTPPRSSRSPARPATLTPAPGGSRPWRSTRSPTCRLRRPAAPSSPTCCAGTGRSRRCTTSGT